VGLPLHGLGEMLFSIESQKCLRNLRVGIRQQNGNNPGSLGGEGGLEPFGAHVPGTIMREWEILSKRDTFSVEGKKAHGEGIFWGFRASGLFNASELGLSGPGIRKLKK